MASDEYEVVQDVCHHGGSRQHETVFGDDDGVQIVEIAVDDDRLSRAVIRDDVDVSAVDHHPPLIVFQGLEETSTEDPDQYGVDSDDIVLQPAEEVIDDGGRFVVDYTDDDVDLNGGLGSCITVGDQPDIGGVLEVLAEDDDDVYNSVGAEVVDIVLPTSPPHHKPSHRGGGRSRSRRGGTSRPRGVSMAHRGAGDAVMPFLGGRQTQGHVVAVAQNQPQWRRKQVQVKTVDGEFSVTMWAAAENNAGNFFNNHFIS